MSSTPTGPRTPECVERETVVTEPLEGQDVQPHAGSGAEADTAPAPPPREPLPQSKAGGFKPSGSRVLLELLFIAVLLFGIGASALWGGGALAAALLPVFPTRVDEKLGSVANAALPSPACGDPRAKEYVEALARPLLDAARPLPFEFTFRVANDPAINAFALPGGFVTVNAGLLSAAQTSEEIAGVLAHEIQHALLRHGTRRLLREMGGSVALNALLGGSELGSFAGVAATLASLKYDRNEESEADGRGLELMRRAGIDPAGLADFFERLHGRGPTPPELLSTHPDPGGRARTIRAQRVPPETRRVLPPIPQVKCD